MLRALLVSHGDLARSLLATAQGIVGATTGVEAMSNEGLSREGLAGIVEQALASWNGEPGLVLTDLLGGSCTQAALTAAARRNGVSVVAGMNLAMLVDFLVNRDNYAAADMAERLVEKGRAGVRAVPAPGAERAGAA